MVSGCASNAFVGNAMDVIVRDAIYTDLPFLVANNQAMAREAEGIELDPNVLEMGVCAVFDDRERGVYFIAECDGAPAGSLMITKEWSDWRCAWYFWIQSVYVLPDYRKQGVFSALFDHVMECMRKFNATAVRLYVDRGNEAAIEAYLKLGMKHSHYDLYEIDVE
jgi:GNAT superfamily N-acetyltransferase